MKKLLFAFIFIGMSASAQIINFTDPNLKALLVGIQTNDYLAATGFDGNTFSEWTTIDTNGDGEIQISEAAQINYLDLHLKGITSLGGLEHFTNLISLDANNNPLGQVDFMGNSSLWVVDLEETGLTTINVLGMNNLRVLKVAYNQLTALDVSGLPLLESVHCSANQLTELDFHTNPEFYDLGCNHNNLVSLNIQNGKPQNTLIGMMWTDGWGDNPNMSVCADADEIDAVSVMLDYIYPTIDIPVVNCALQSVDFDNAKGLANVYPNPVAHMLYIDAQGLHGIRLYDTQGRLIGSYTGTAIDLSGYQSGVYYVAIATDSGNRTQKIIKK